MTRLTPLASFAALIFAGCAGESVDCIIDSDCAEGQYCVSTACADPVPLADSEAAYRTQIAPLLEVGCNCHGPGTGRPWSYEHRFDDPAATRADMAVLRQWLYDPLQAEGTDGRPTAWLYGLAQCGFNHPGVYAGPTEPQYRMLMSWAAQAVPELPVIQAVDVAVPPNDPPAEAPLPDLEAQALQAIRTSPYAQGMRQEILPRVLGQCGCCHAGDGRRGWKLVSLYPPEPPPSEDAGPPPTEEELIARDIATIEGYANRLNPDQSRLLRYGLGANGAIEAHPKIFSSADDPRYRLLREWMAQGPPPPEN